MAVENILLFLEEWRMIMIKSEKWKTIFKSKSLIYIVIAFAVAPVAINLGLVFTDIIYEKTGNTLTAKGLNNAEWLGFWKQYLAIAISFVGLCVAYVSSNTDRKHKRQEEQAQQYLEGVRQEENVLVDVTQGFNISIVYKALLQQSKSANIYDGRMVLTNARANMDQMHIKFEILTELCDDFKKCENCRYLPCIDRKVMIELRDLFYDIEKHYFNMLDIGESFLECLDKEQERKNCWKQKQKYKIIQKNL